MRFWVGFAIVLSAALSGQAPALDQVVERTTAYVESYTASLRGIVGEERYVQKSVWRTPGPASAAGFELPRERRLVSDFRTTPIGDEWFGMRRVRESPRASRTSAR